MPVPTLPDLLASLLESAATAVVAEKGVHLDTLPPAQVQATGDPTHGDYQSNLAMRLGRPLKTPPPVLARELREKVLATGHPAVAEVEVAGPGFLNFRLATPWLATHLAALAADADLGVARDGAGRRVVIDYGSPNVAKRMHVGHLRSTNIGAALVAMHRAAGWDVVGDNHIGDWGTQFGKLIVAWRAHGDEAAFAEDAIGELERLYVLVTRLAAEDPALEAQARHETAKLQAGDPENRALWERFVAASMVEFERMYARMGVKFDAVLGESFYQPVLGEIVHDLLDRGIAVVDDGAVVVPLTPADGPGVGKAPLLVRKRDGASLYGTTDVATLRHRERTWDPHRVVYVTDGRQQLHFQQVFATARKAGYTDAELLHVWFGVLKLPEGQMSTRMGNVIRLVDLFDEAVRRARAVVDEKSPDLGDEERAAIAECVGIGAVKYADLSQNPQSDVTFEWDRMLSMDGNTAPFMLYSHARCRSILRKAGVEAPSSWTFAVGQPEERDLALALARFPEALRGALAAWRPNLLCDYLFGLAGTFNRFYREVPVLRAEEPARTGRLALVAATAQVLHRGLGLVGIPALERM